MKKPKPPKPKKPKSQQQPAQAAHQPPHLAQDRPTLVKRVSDHPLMLLAAIAATLAALVGLGYDAIRQPLISADPVVDPSRPFAFPFSVKNESWIFDMRDTELYCGIDEAALRGGGGMAGITLKDAARATIEPREEGIFKCSIVLEGGPTSPFDLVRGHIAISVGYRTLWVFQRHSPDTEFTWFTGGSPPHWVKGKVAK
jgi:hypothetical protein